MIVQQVECVEHRDGAGPYNRLVVWVEANRVQFDDIVTFKETGDARWRVTRLYKSRVGEANRGWGLHLPKSQGTER